jgi:SAM-dependent methyltransferase
LIPASLIYRLAQKAKAPVIRRWYDQMSRIDSGRRMLFMNYGWAGTEGTDLPMELLSEDEEDRYCIQLYGHVTGGAELAGLDVLEVGCGRGGGASWISRYLEPRTMTGMDFSGRGIEFCRNAYSSPGLSFVLGDAEEMDFGPESFDAVVNIESSHCYRAPGHFFASVFRILRPGGYFLYADYHSPAELVRTRELLRRSGLVLLREQDISRNVLKALELDDARKATLIRRGVPLLLRGFFKEFAGMQGTRTFNEAFRRGDIIYSSFVLQSPREAGFPIRLLEERTS